MARRMLLVLLVGVLAMTGAALTPAVAAPVVASGVAASGVAASGVAVPGGLTPDGKVLRADDSGRLHAEDEPGSCEQAGVHCKLTSRSDSCTGYSSQTTPPKTIRVLTGADQASIKTVDFQTYVEDVLPNEWYATWDGDALKAGAVAIKTYAWWWVTHYGGYVGESANSSSCFDVTDDPDFQVYEANTGSVNSRIKNLVQQSWPVAVRRDGDLVFTEYNAYLTSAKGKEACGAGADGKHMSQFGSQACNHLNEANNGFRYNVILRLYYGNDIDISTTAQLRTQQDFNFTARSTGGTWNAGQWYIADGYPTTFGFGARGDVPFTPTEGDGFATAAVYRPSNSTFYVGNSQHHVARTTPFGRSGDVPVPAHYAGLDNATQLGVFRPQNGTWYLADAKGGVASATPWGASSDTPVPGRWLSANDDSLAVYRAATGTWFVRNGPQVAWGVKGDVPVPADYTGDGITDIAVYRASTNTFYVRGVGSIGWGVRGDVPVTGDFTGDGKADVAVYRPKNGTIYARGAAAAITAKPGTPLGAAPYRG